MRPRQELRPFRPCLEALEARTVPSGGPLTPVASPAVPGPVALCVVDRLTDGGEGSGWAGDLRYCVTRANASPSADRITFAVTGTINLTHALPHLTGQLSIDGPAVDLLTVRRDTGGDYRIFHIASNATVRIAALTITNGRQTTGERATGGGVLNEGTL